MKIFFLILIVITVSNLYGQKVEIIGGANYNQFHDYKNGEGHYRASYHPGFGFTAGVGMDSCNQ